MHAKPHSPIDPASASHPGNTTLLLAMDYVGLTDDLLRTHPVMATKIASATQIPQEAVPGMLVEVLRFLSLIAFSGKVLTPPNRLDLAWHEFILFTAAYAKFCQKHFGRFLHHAPGGSDEDNNFQLRRTLKLYTLYFGSPNPEYWGDHGYFSEPATCGSCEGT